MTPCGENLTLEELLNDPLTRAVMRADRVDPSELETMLGFVASALRSAAGRVKAAGEISEAERAASDRGALGRLLRSIDLGPNEASRCTAARSGLRSLFCGAA